MSTHVGDSHVPRLMSKSNEWYTPKKYIDAVKEVFGGMIELDPASCAQANETVGAERCYTQEQDGLSCSWKARTLFLNPPYGRGPNHKSNQEIWGSRLIFEYETGNVGEAILLVNAATGRGDFEELFNYPICFHKGRIHFDGPNSKEGPTHDSVFVYFGPHTERFVEVFRRFGPVVLPERVVR